MITDDIYLQDSINTAIVKIVSTIKAMQRFVNVDMFSVTSMSRPYRPSWLELRHVIKVPQMCEILF